MPVRRLLEHNDVFGPEDVQILLGAFNDTVRALNLTDRERPLRMMVAKLIIEFGELKHHHAAPANRFATVMQESRIRV